MYESPLAIYRRHLAQGQLAYQYDPQTRRPVFPPRVLGPGSGNGALQWRISAGLGAVHAVTVVRPRDGAPYNVVLVDMDEGFRLMSRVETAGGAAPVIGMRVRLRAQAAQEDGDPFPVFEAATGHDVAAAAPDTPAPAQPRAIAVGPGLASHAALQHEAARGTAPLPLRRGAVAIVGAAESDLGKVAPGLGPLDLMAQAVGRALDDCGLTLGDVDGVFATTSQSRMPTLALCETLGIQPRHHDGTNIGGASFLSMVARAHAAIEAGLCQVAVIAYGSTQRSMGRANVAAPDPNPHEAPYRPLYTASSYALAASRHMHVYGTTREQLAEVAVAARQWALRNPAAWEKKPLTVAEVLASPMISDPLTLRDCCLVTDGGGALVLTGSDRARDLRRPPAYVLGHGEALSHYSISAMPDLTATAAARSGALAYRMAGLAPQDMDVLQLYDAFTITTLLFLEDLGFCPKGEGGRFVQGGRIAPGGALAVNTSGGGLSYCHPGMYGIFALIEAVRQLRGECGARQVAGCRTALVHGNGGTLSSQSTVVLGNAAAL
ncbi:hypothetical protein CAL13_00900 [Bordetella genomosp. 9]|uniref:Thiolase n=1 Tax=Bordetella genomosp. 9 TaxID=1416803 RepID=A0A1W6YV10_9BORD|nr:hypothetical protein CAL13_00900 [Bordetella genomosp. 9]